VPTALAFGIEANYVHPADLDLPDAARCNALFDFDTVRNGYGWIFPKRDHFNVGIYRISKGDGASGLKGALARFAAAHPLLRRCRMTEAVGQPIPISTGTQPVGRGRVILIGDAAGLGEAFFGEGIAFALRSAAIAADWIGRTMRAGSAPDGARFGAELRPLMDELRYSLRIAQAMYRVPPAWMGRLGADGTIREALVMMLEGRSSYRSSFWRIARRIPFAIARRGGMAAAPSPFDQDAAGNEKGRGTV